MLVHHLLENSAKSRPDKVALICGIKRFTYQQINLYSDQVAAGLIRMGLRQSDRVIIFLDNSFESVVSLFGIIKAGAIAVPINSTIKPKKLNYILKDSGSVAIIVDSVRFDILGSSLEGVTTLRYILTCDAEKQPNSKCHNDLHSTLHIVQFDHFFKDKAIDQLSKPRIIDIDLAMIIYTSGSTGGPRGVMSAHYNVLSAVRSISHFLDNNENDIILNTLPLSFDYGLYQILITFMGGGALILEKSFGYPYKIIERLVQERVTGFPIVPTIAAILIKMEKLSEYDFSSLRYLTNTAATIPVDHINKIRSIFPSAKFFSMYGLTECKRVSYLPPEYIDTKPGSVGIPIENESVKIVDGCGNEVSPGEVGELVVRGSNVMQGYWNSLEDTLNVFRPGKYRGETLLYTGDLFRQDEDGFLYFISRRDDLIKTKGERVAPKEIEDAINSLNEVVEVAVIGIPEEIIGQAVKAFIVVDDHSRLTEKQILQYCSENLEPFMVPKYIEFKRALPKLPNGKIDKQKL